MFSFYILDINKENSKTVGICERMKGMVVIKILKGYFSYTFRKHQKK